MSLEPTRRDLRAAVAGVATPPIYEEPPEGWQIERNTLLAVISRVFDLAEGREPGHAARVAFIGVRLGERLGLAPGETGDIFSACLLHDMDKVVGAKGPGEDAGDPSLTSMALMRTVAGFGLGPRVAEAIADHRRFGWLATAHSTPHQETGLGGRLVAAAERLDSVAAGGRSALLIRRRGREIARSLAVDGFGPELADAVEGLTSDDSFWIGYYGNDLIATLGAELPGERLDLDATIACCSTLADLIDRRNGHPAGRARRVAALAEMLAKRLGDGDERARLISLAAMLQDIGTPGIPAAHVRKPDLLTVDELADVQNHPILARDILSELPGLGAIAWWVACHHERIDGRGYPGGLAGEEIPLEAQMIGLCETYEALIRDRPHRPAMSSEDALDVLDGLAGARFLPELVRAARQMIEEADRTP